MRLDEINGFDRIAFVEALAARFETRSLTRSLGLLLMRLDEINGLDCIAFVEALAGRFETRSLTVGALLCTAEPRTLVSGLWGYFA